MKPVIVLTIVIVLTFLFLSIPQKSPTGLQTVAMDAPPVFLGANLSASVLVPLQLNVSQYFSDPENQPLMFLVDDPAATIAGDRLTFTAPANSSSEYVLNIQASDGVNTIYKPLSVAVVGAAASTVNNSGVQTSSLALALGPVSKSSSQGSQTSRTIEGTRMISAVCGSTINACCDITSPGSYLLNVSISAGTTCITISANNVVFNCNGSTINFSRTGSGFGINVGTGAGIANVTIENCNVTQANSSVTSSIPIELFKVNESEVLNTSVFTAGVLTSPGIKVEGPSRNTRIINTNATAGADAGISVSSSAVNVTLIGDSASGTHGFAFEGTGSGDLSEETIRDSVGQGTTSGFRLVLINNSVVVNSTGISSSGAAFVLGGDNITLINSTGRTNTGVALSSSVSPVSNSSFSNVTLESNSTWLAMGSGSTRNTLSNMTFASTNGSIRILNVTTIPESTTVDVAHLNTSTNHSFLNASNLSFLNVSAQITLDNLPFTNPRMLVDGNDSNSFVVCSSPQCVQQSYNGSTFVFNVSHFTSYAAAETGACPGAITVSTNLTQNVSASGTCVTIAAANVVLDCKGFTLTWNTGGGSGGDTGVLISTSASNATVKNCVMVDGSSGSGSGAIGVSVTASNAVIRNNSIQVSGLTTNYGVDLESSVGLQVDNVLVENNSIFSNGTTGNEGIRLGTDGGTTSSNNTFRNNVVVAQGTGGTNIGIDVMPSAGSTASFILNNSVRANGTTGNIGIQVFAIGGQHQIANNTVVADGTVSTRGILVTFNTQTTEGGSVTNNSASANGASSYGIRVERSHNYVFDRNTVFASGNASYGVSLGTANVTVNNTVLTGSSGWVFDEQTVSPSNQRSNFTNTTFSTGNGSIRFAGTIAFVDNVTLNQSDLNVSSNRAFLNTTAFSFLNTSAQITLRNLNATSHSARVDFADTGSFVACDASNCTVVSDSAGTFVYNVTHFTRYSSSEVGVCPGLITVNTNLTSSVSSNGTCVSFGANNIVLDCQGFTMTYDLAGNSSGVIRNVGVLASVRNNVTVQNCVIVDGNASGSNGFGVFLNSTGNSTVTNNSIRTNGTSDNYGVYVLTVGSNTVSNNSIFASGTTLLNVGVYLDGASRNVVRGNVIRTNGSDDNIGVDVVGVGAGNNTLGNNSIFTDGSTNFNFGIFLTSAPGNVVVGNVIVTNGTDSNQGVRVVGVLAANNTITNNSIATRGSSSSNVGVFLSSAPGNLVAGNLIQTNGTASNYGVHVAGGVNNSVFNNTIVSTGTGTANYGVIVSSASANSVANNVIRANGTTDNYGIYVDVSSSNSFANNVVQTNGSTNNYGIFISGSASSNNSVDNNSIFASGTSVGNVGVYVSSAPRNVVTRNVIVTNGTGTSFGIRVQVAASVNNTFRNNVITARGGGTSDGVLVDAAINNSFSNTTVLAASGNQVNLTSTATGNMFDNTTLNGTTTWIVSDVSSVGNNFTRTLFNSPLGSILMINQTTVPANVTLSMAKLNTTLNRSFVNVSNLSFFNVSAQITLHGLSFSNPQAAVDANDTGVFVSCGSPQCVAQSYNGSTFVFNVTHFTSYAVSAGSSCPLNVSTSTTLTENLSCPGTAVNITANNVVFDCNGFVINYSSQVAGNGILAFNQSNVTVKNCKVLETNLSISSESSGIRFNGVTASLIQNSSGNATGSASHGIMLDNQFGTGGEGNRLQDVLGQGSTLSGFFIAGQTHLSAVNVIGISINDSAFGVQTTGNSSFTNVTGVGGVAAVLDSGSENNNFTNVNASGGLLGIDFVSSNDRLVNVVASASGSFGVGFELNGNSNTVVNATVFDSDGTGMDIAGGYNTIVNSSVSSNSNAALRLAQANGTFMNNVFSSNSSFGLTTTLSPRNNTFVNNTFSSASGIVLNLISANNISFVNTTLRTNGTWVKTDSASSSNNLTNTLFQSNEGSIFVINTTTIPASLNVSMVRLNTSLNRSFMNASNLSFLNVSAQVTLHDLNFTNPRVVVDVNDNNVFAVCSAPDCVNVSYNGSTFVFNVTHFTSYAASESAVCPLNIASSTTLTENVSCPATAINILANNVVLDCAGFTISYANSVEGFGVNSTDRSNVTIKNCNISKTSGVGSPSHGIFLQGGSGHVVLNNSVNLSGSLGIDVVSVVNVSLLNNIVRATGQAAIFLTGSNESVLSNNNATSDISGIFLSAGSNNNVLTNNTGTGDHGIDISTSLNNVLVSNTGIGPTSNIGIALTDANNSVLVNNTGTSGSLQGIRLIRSNNNTLTNNTGSSGSSGQGIRLETSSNNNILVQNNGTSSTDDGILLTTSSSNNTLTRNNGTSSTGAGISLFGSGNNNVLVNNTGTSVTGHGIVATSSNNTLSGNRGSSGSGQGIRIASGAENNTLTSNTGTSLTGVGISLFGSAKHNVLVNNAGTSSSGQGIRIDTSSSNNVLMNNTGTSLTGAGIFFIASANHNVLVNNTGTSTSNRGIVINSSSNNTLVNTTATSGSGTALVFITSAQNNTLENTILRTGDGWITADGTSSGNNMSNTTFLQSNGSILIPSLVVVPVGANVSQRSLNTSFNRSFLNSSNLSFLNVSAQITLHNLNFSNPRVVVDANDNNNFVVCSGPQCVNQSYNGSTFIFNVSHFTSYAASEIANTHPTIQQVILNSTSGTGATQNTSFDTENLTAFIINASDADGDHVENITDWRVNNVSIAVLNMPFETNVSSVNGSIKDYSTFVNNGTLGNGSAGTQPVWNGSGKVGGAYTFNGINQSITLGDVTSMDGATAISFGGWINPGSYAPGPTAFDVRSVMSKSNYNGDGNITIAAFFSGVNQSNGTPPATFNCFVDTAAVGDGFVDVPPGTFPIGSWTQFMCTWASGGPVKLYVNGTLVSTGSSVQTGGLNNVPHPLLIGSSNFSGEDTFNGSIDEVVIFNRSLSAQEVNQSYQDGLAARHLGSIVSSELSVGDNWSVAVTPNDNQNASDGNMVLSNGVLIVSSCPLSVSTSTTLTENVTCPATAINVLGSDLTLDCAGKTVTFDTAGAGSDNGILAQSRRNVTVKNCIFTDGNASGASGVGVQFVSVNDSRVVNNTVQTNGTSLNHGILLQNNANNNVVENNTVRTNGNESANVGIYLFTHMLNNSVVGNSITTQGTSNNYGVFLESNANNTRVENNSVVTMGTNDTNLGIFVFTNSSNNIVERNTISTNGTFQNHGILLETNSSNNSVRNNVVSTHGNSSSNIGIFLFDSENNNVIANNSIQTDGLDSNRGITLNTFAENNIVANNTIRTNGAATSNIGIFLTTSVSNNTVEGNDIVTNGTASNQGVFIIAGNNNIVRNNTVVARGTGDGNDGVVVATSSQNNIVVNNSLTTGGGTGNHGVLLISNVNGTLVANNSILTRGSAFNVGVFLLTNVSNNTVRGNVIVTNGTDSSNHGVFLEVEANNNVVENNVIRTGLAGSSFEYGVLVFGNASNNHIRSNVILASGINGSNGILLDDAGIGSTVDNNTIDNNTFIGNAAGSFNAGILLWGAQGTNVTNNKVNVTGADRNMGIKVENGVTRISSGNLIKNNVIRTNGSAENNFGITFSYNSSNNVVRNNNITTNGTSSNVGIRLTNGSRDNVFENNVVFAQGSAGGNFGVLLTNVSGNNFTNNTVSSGNDGFSILRSSGNVFDGNVILAHNDSSISVSRSLNNVFVNSFIPNGSASLFINETNGLIAFADSLNLSTSTNLSRVVSILANRIFVNTSDPAGNQLNKSAKLFLFGISFIDPRPVVDANDSGAFMNCDPPVCVEESFTGGVFVFDVSHFTAYASAEQNVSATLLKIAAPDPAIAGTLLNYTITFNVTDGNASNVTILETYPLGVSFVSSQPAPTSGDDTFAVGNLTAGQSLVINITVNVSGLLNNGTVINNTVTATFQNSTNGLITLNTTIGTAVLSSIFNSTITNSTVSNSTINNSNVTDSTKIDSFVTSSSNLDCIVIASNETDSVCVDSNLTGSSATNSSITNSSKTNTTMVDANVTSSTNVNCVVVASNETNTNCISSLFNGTSVTDSNVTNSSKINSTVVNATVTDSVNTNCTVSSSTESGSNCTNSVLDNTQIFNSNVTNSNKTNSVIINSTITNSVNFNCTIVNGVEQGTNCTSSSTADSTLINVILDGSNVTNSTKIDSNISNSNVSDSLNNNCVLNNSVEIASSCTKSTVQDSIVQDSVLTNSSAVNSTIVNSTKINSVMVDASIVSSTNMNCTIVNSSESGVSCTNSFIQNSTVVNSTIINSSVLNATVVNNFCFNGTIIFNDTVFPCPVNLSDIYPKPAPAPTPSGGGGGSGGGRGAPSQIKPNETKMQGDYFVTPALSQNDVVTFTVQGERHALTVLSVFEDSVRIGVASALKEYVVKKAVVSAIDVTGDGSVDLTVEVVSIEDHQVVLKMHRVGVGRLPQKQVSIVIQPPAEVPKEMAVENKTAEQGEMSVSAAAPIGRAAWFNWSLHVPEGVQKVWPIGLGVVLLALLGVFGVSALVRAHRRSELELPANPDVGSLLKTPIHRVRIVKVNVDVKKVHEDMKRIEKLLKKYDRQFKK